MRTFSFNDWRAGVRGSGNDEGPTYDAVDAHVYEDGTLGPRPGWKPVTISGTPPTGSYLSLQQYLGDILYVDDELVLVNEGAGGNDARITRGGFNLLTNTWTVGTQGNIANLPAIDDQPITAQYLGNQSFSANGGISTGLSTSPSIPNTSDGYPGGVVVFKDRAYYFGFDSAPGRVYYSDPADFTTVGSTSFIDLAATTGSGTWAVIGAWVVQNRLLFATDIGDWFSLSGNPEVGSLTAIGNAAVPDSWRAAGVFNGYVWFLTDGGMVLASPSGIDNRTFGTIQMPENDAFILLAGAGFDRDIGTARTLTMPSDNFVILSLDPDTSTEHGTAYLEFVNNAWVWTHFYDSSLTEEIQETVNGNRGLIFRYSLDNDTSDTIQIWSRDAVLDRPGNTSDTQSTTAETEGFDLAKVEIPRIAADPGKLIRPTALEIEFNYWKGTGYDDPTITTKVSVEGVKNAAGSDSATDVVIESGSGAQPTWDDAEAAHRSARVNLDHVEYGSSIVVGLEFNGVAIENIHVIYEEQERTEDG